MFCLRTFCLYGRFVPLDVLSLRTFVPTDVLSLRTFCPYGRFVPRTLCLRLFCLRTFCLRTFCPYGRFVSGRFVWAPKNLLEDLPQSTFSAKTNRFFSHIISIYIHRFILRISQMHPPNWIRLFGITLISLQLLKRHYFKKEWRVN